MDVGHNTLVDHAAIERADLPVRVYNGMGSVGGNHLRQGRKERIQHNTPSTQLHKPKVFVLGLIPKDVQQPVGPPSSWSPINPVAVIQVGEPGRKRVSDGIHGCHMQIKIWVARVASVASVGLIHWETLPSSSGLRSRWQHMVPRQEYHGGSGFPRKSTTDEKGQGKRQIKAGASSGHESQQPTKAHECLYSPAGVQRQKRRQVRVLGTDLSSQPIPWVSVFPSKVGTSSGHGSQQPAKACSCVPRQEYNNRK
ncbi:hypothetical protein K438DRAFT_1852505 [Mycena galopus ATCC 62051]|nr:hypothetical protein K438DRAFT_1852505 [Mycena galopus ATCC 62051]